MNLDSFKLTYINFLLERLNSLILAAFCELLLAVAYQKTEPIRVILTNREEFNYKEGNV